jgi:TRAP-type C4-dicarboxylate transport system permease small subunit
MRIAELVTVLSIVVSTIVGAVYGHIWFSVLFGGAAWVGVLPGGFVGFALMSVVAAMFFALLEIADNTRRHSKADDDAPVPMERSERPNMTPPNWHAASRHGW